MERFKQGVPNKSDSIFGKFWGVFLSFFHVFKKLCKAIYEGHYFFRKWKSTKKTFQIPLLAFDFSELFFCDSAKKNSKNCLCVLAELFLFFRWLASNIPLALWFLFFLSEKIKNNESTFNYAIHQCCFSCVDGMYSNKIALPAGRLKRFSITTTLVSGTTKTF